MAKTDNSKKKKSESAPEGGDIHVGGNISGDHIVVGSNNFINNYYQIVEKNTKQNDPDFWNLKHPYPMPPNFTGRIEERALLTQWLDGDSENRLFILRALGGFGKSALAWQWLTHDVNPETWKKVVFWSFYEGDASFEHFTSETLEYLGIEVPRGGRPQVDELLKAMQKENILLILDGLERVLRLYANMIAAYQEDEEEKVEENQLDCKDINAEWFFKGICSNPKFKSKVLMTTRHSPRAIKPRGEFMLGCHEVELSSMQPSDAVEFFQKQGIKGHRIEIEAACAPYGYHPLSLRLLAGRVLKDFENPGDIAVAQTLKIDSDIKSQRLHVLEVAFNGLPDFEQKLISNISCFRYPVDMKSIQHFDIALGITGQRSIQDALQDLVERGLVNFEKSRKKFDLHPIVKRYTYQKNSPDERISAHKFLQDYYYSIFKGVNKERNYDQIELIIELYFHTIQVNEADKAWVLYRTQLSKLLYYQLGRYETVIELLSMLFNGDFISSSKLTNLDFISWTLNEVSNSYCLIGQPQRARATFERKIKIDSDMNKPDRISAGYGNMASVMHLSLGELKNAEEKLKFTIKFHKSQKLLYQESSDRLELGHVLIQKGDWTNSEIELSKAIEIARKDANLQVQTVIWAYRSLRFLQILRDKKQAQQKYIKLAIEYAVRSLELAEKIKSSGKYYAVDFVRGNWFLGTAYRVNNELTISEENLTKALNLCRQINLVEMEADILLELAKLRYAQGDFKDAQEKASEALVITERSGYVLKGADVNLFLAQYALEQEKDKAKAKEYAEEALKLATCDGPPYYYKVAYEEAEAMLEKF